MPGNQPNLNPEQQPDADGVFIIDEFNLNADVKEEIAHSEGAQSAQSITEPAKARPHSDELHNALVGLREDETRSFDRQTSWNSVSLDRMVEAIKEKELEQRFAPERLSRLATEFLWRGPYGNIVEQARGKERVMGIVRADDPEFADLGKGPETIVFAERFERTKLDVYEEYEVCDPASVFIIAIDVTDIENPKVAGSLRVMDDSSGIQLETITVLSKDDPDPAKAPWRDEVHGLLFEKEGKAFDPLVVWERMCEREGITLDPKDTHDIATLAVFEEYRDKKGALDGDSIRLYNACLRHALACGKKNLITIQDWKPFLNLQQYGEPFDQFSGLTPRPYGGPGNTVVAVSVLEKGMAKIRANDEFIGKIFIDSFGMEGHTLLLQQLDPATYSAESVGLA